MDAEAVHCHYNKKRQEDGRGKNGDKASPVMVLFHFRHPLYPTEAYVVFIDDVVVTSKDYLIGTILAQIHISSSFHAVYTSSKGFVFQAFPLPSVYRIGRKAASGNVCKFFTNAKKFPQFYSMGAGHGSDLGGKLNTGAGREGEARRVRGLFRFPP